MEKKSKKDKIIEIIILSTMGLVVFVAGITLIFQALIGDTLFLD